MSKIKGPAISIIVPIYNMERLMRKCIDTILSQTFTDFECLLIDDGSTDKSPAICDEYAQMDSRIIVFHKPNGGLSDARNYGIEHAQGEYSIFADPDDWVDAEGLDQLYEKAKESKADLTICDAYYNDFYQQKYSKQQPTSLNHMDLIQDLLTGKISGYTWNKLIRTELYELYRINYPYGIYGCEDQYTICKLLKNNIHIEYVPIAFYHYMHYGNETQSRRYDKATYLQDIKIRDMFVELLADTPHNQLAYECKTLSFILRAFHLGRKVFTAQSYKIEFERYKLLIKKLSGINRFLLLLSINGYYPLAKTIFNTLFQTKQYWKSFSSKFFQKIC